MFNLPVSHFIVRSKVTKDDFVRFVVQGFPVFPVGSYVTIHSDPAEQNDELFSGQIVGYDITESGVDINVATDQTTKGRLWDRANSTKYGEARFWPDVIIFAPRAFVPE